MSKHIRMSKSKHTICLFFTLVVMGFFVTFLSPPSETAAATVSQLWEAAFNSCPLGGDINPRGMALDQQGDIYVCGESDLNTWGAIWHTYPLLIKYSSKGSKEWDRTYNSGHLMGKDKVSGLAVDSQGNIYVTGDTDVTSSDRRMFILKYDQSGKQLWIDIKTKNIVCGSELRPIATDDKGNFYVIGRSLQSSQMFVKKCNSEGGTVWLQWYEGNSQYPGSYDYYPQFLTVDGQGNVYVTGYASNFSSEGIPNYHFTLKYDTGGKLIWDQPYRAKGENWNFAYGLAVDLSGDVYVLVRTENNKNIIIKYQGINSGQIWESLYAHSPTGNDNALALGLAAKKTPTVTGWFKEANNIDYCYTVQYDASTGNQNWAATYPHSASGPINWGEVLAGDDQGYIYVGGRAAGAKGLDMTTVKYDFQGKQEWAIHHPGACEAATGIAVSSQGEVVVTGFSGTGNMTCRYGLLTVKYVQQ